MVIKRSMGAGFAGIENPLYYMDKTLMLFGDAKNFGGAIVRESAGGLLRSPECRSGSPVVGSPAACRGGGFLRL
jgi:hypothetical protein